MDLNQYANAIASIESAGSGDYRAVGPRTRKGNRAYGRYQVMDFNIGPWTEKYLGQRLTPEQFLESPEAQDAVFQGEFGSYVNRYGNPQDAASAWFTGQPMSQGAGRSDILGTTGAGYVQKFNAALGQPQGGDMQPTGLLGTPTVSTQGQAQEQEKLPFFQRPGTADFFDRLAIGLQGMTLNPNEALMRAAQSRIEGRRKDAQTAQQRNRTADWLESQGMAAAAEGVRSGAIGARDALALARGGEATAAQRNYEFLISQGMSPEQAMERAFGGGVTVNTGEPMKIMSDGRIAIADPSVDGGVRFVTPPGSKAAIEAEEAARREKTIETQRGTKESVVARDVDRLIDMIDKGGIFDLPEAGIVGGALGSLGINQEAVTFRNTLAGIQSQVAFDRLQQMREASKTGGALGAVSERELDLLMSALGALQQTTDPQTLKENLTFIRDTMTKIENDPVASQAYYGGGRGASAGGTGGGFSVTGVID